jgi:hypothetical protein
VPRISKQEREAAFKFMLYASSHAKKSFKYILKNQVPDQDLLDLSDETSGKKHPIFPRSMHTRGGQVLALTEAKKVQQWREDMPWMAFTLRDQGYRAADQAYRTESKHWGRAIVDSILVRVAEERTPTVLMSYESLQAAVKALAGSSPHLTKVREILDRLVLDGVPFSVVHGKRGGFGKASKFTVKLPTHTEAITRAAKSGQGEVDDWLMERGYGLNTAMKWEQVARETVLERKSAYAAAAGGILPDVEEWITANQVSIGRVHQVSFPGDGFSSLLEGEARARTTGNTLVTSFPTPSDQQLQKFDVPKKTPPAPAPKRISEPWFERARKMRQAGRIDLAAIAEDLDFTVPVPKKPTWAEVRKTYEQDSLARLDARLAAKGIRP